MRWKEDSNTFHLITELSAVFEDPGLCYRNMPAVITTAVGQMAASKGRQGKEAQNLVQVYQANIRLKEIETNILITAYEPLVIKKVGMITQSTPAILKAIVSLDLLFNIFFVYLCDCSPLSETASAAGVGVAIPTAESGVVPMDGS
ncbi:putative ran guanine nucleotide release factor-like isoform 2 [Capsicum annuum]|nr:putative ran guanine nucleotide release factor-like isoform 2 [Capsicum annuum]